MSQRPRHDEDADQLTMAYWMLGGAALGVVIWLVFDMFVFFPVFIGCGLAIGIAAEQSRAKR